VTGLAAALGAAASAGAAGLINVWHQRPGKRSDFRTRRSGSILIGWAQLVVTLMIGGATALAAVLSPFALIPAVLAGVALLFMRRNDAQIAEALSAEA
jgi:ABC-2 type transport system permease protein